MATTIVGLFDNENTVRQIESGLKDRGIDAKYMDKVNWRDLSEGRDPWGIGKSGDEEDKVTNKLVDELKARGVPDDDAHEFARAVRGGGNLVVTEVEDDQKADEVEYLMDESEAAERGEKVSPRGDGQRTRPKNIGGDQARVQKAREDVKVGKRDVQTGGVRVRKRVEERPVEEEVNLREEHVDVEHQKVDEPISPDEDVFKEETIELTEHGEEPVVEKETRVEEEVLVGKDVEEHTETVKDTERVTTIDVDELSASVPKEQSFSNYEPQYRQHFDSEYGDKDYRFEDYEPAYRYGHTFGASDRYQGRDYKSVESDLQNSYEEEHGRGTFERYKDAIRHGFESARKRL